jgi:hypothetical protein
VLFFARRDEAAVGKDDVRLDEAVDRKPQLALGDQARPLVDHRVVELPGGVVVGIVRFDHPATEACAERLCELHVGGNGSSHGFPPLSSRDPTPARGFLSRRRHRRRSSIERL